MHCPEVQRFFSHVPVQASASAFRALEKNKQYIYINITDELHGWFQVPAGSNKPQSLKEAHQSLDTQY